MIWIRLLLAAITVSLLPIFSQAQSSSRPYGELLIINTSGEVVSRLGLKEKPRALAFTAPDRVLVALSGEIIEIGASEDDALKVLGPIAPIPAGIHDVIAVLPERNGDITILGNQGETARITSDGESQGDTSPLFQDMWLTSAVKLTGGEIIVAARNARQPTENFYLIEGYPHRSHRPLSFDEAPPHRNHPRVAAGVDNSFFVHDDNWGKIFRVVLEQNSLKVVNSMPISGATLVASDGLGGLVYNSFGNSLAHYKDNSLDPPLTLARVPEVLGFDAKRKHYIIGNEILPDRVWPDIRYNQQPWHIFDWRTFYSWLLLWPALLFSSCLVSRFFSSDKSCFPEIIDRDEHAGKVVQLHTVNSKKWLLIVLNFTAIVGIAVLIFAMLQFSVVPGPKWFYVLTASAMCSGFSLAILSARLGARPIHFFRTCAAAKERLRPMTLSYYVLVLGVVCYSLIYYGLRHQIYSERVGIWAATILFLLTVATWSIFRDFCRDLSAPSTSAILAFLLVFAIGGTVLFYRLSSIPTNCHFDFNFYVYSALDVIEGRIDSIWQNGFVPSPVIGLFPEMLGLVIGGLEPFGFRLGPALFGLTGGIAIYLLGSQYRTSLVGLWAALFLFGNIPYMHFSRLASNGESAITALWAITLFVLAMRFRSIGLWMLTGLLCGLAFYLWPVSRVGMAAIGLFCLTTFILHPRLYLDRFWEFVVTAACFLVMISPLIPMWIENPVLMLPRVYESMVILKSQEGIQWHGLQNDFLIRFLRSFAWFHWVHDQSTQGTISPALNFIETILFLIGLFIFFFERPGLNILYFLFLIVTLVVCGVWSDSTPMYTRLLPGAVFSALACARALDALCSNKAVYSAKYRSLILVLVTLGIVYVSPYQNFRRYLAYESGSDGTYNMGEMTAIGLKISELGNKYTYYLVSDGRFDWGLSGGRFGELLPHIFPLSIVEVRELELSIDSISPGGHAFILQAARWEKDMAAIRTRFPKAVHQPIRGFQNELKAMLVTVESG